MRGNILLPQPKQVKEINFLSNTTKFTLVVYWEKKKDNTFWNIWETRNKKNRKYIDSYDYHLTDKFKSVTRHDEAFYKLYVYCQKNIGNAFQMLIYMNDFASGTQYKICSLTKNELECKINMPTFSEANEQGHVYVDGLSRPPTELETSELIQRVLTKKPKNINDYLKQAA